LLRFQEDIIFGCDSTIALIKLNAFSQCIGGTLDTVMKRNEKGHERTILSMSASPAQAKHIESINMKLSNMIMIKKLGFGQFGSVYLVKNKETSKMYALKCISKQQVLEQNLESNFFLF
jgi:cGMP-dependent protein kinase